MFLCVCGVLCGSPVCVCVCYVTLCRADMNVL